ISADGSYLSPGDYSVGTTGGADAPKFSAQITIPAMPVLTSPAPDAPKPTLVTRSNGLTVTWTGGQANQIVQLEGFNTTDITYTVGADFLCSVPASAGTFTIPPDVLMPMPAGSLGGLLFRPLVTPVGVTGTGLNVAFVDAAYQWFAPLNFN
ncbi:MAG: hypothetical protein JST11_23440, partial [Acidobacteria bacterium]|nr:hypothetical protein [Acidobacteriota bacterium]